MEEKKDTYEPLGVLRTSGTVLGTCLLKKGEILDESFPCNGPSLVKVCRVIDGLTKECKMQGREVDQMAFGYNGGNILALSIGDYRLIIMHLMTDEIDFLANTARAYLKDIITPPEPVQDACAKVAGEEDPRANILPGNQATFDDSSNKLIGENMSVEGLVEYFADQYKNE